MRATLILSFVLVALGACHHSPASVVESVHVTSRFDLSTAKATGRLDELPVDAKEWFAVVDVRAGDGSKAHLNWYAISPTDEVLITTQEMPMRIGQMVSRITLPETGATPGTYRVSVHQGDAELGVRTFRVLAPGAN